VLPSIFVLPYIHSWILRDASLAEFRFEHLSAEDAIFLLQRKSLWAKQLPASPCYLRPSCCLRRSVRLTTFCLCE